MVQERVVKKDMTDRIKDMESVFFVRTTSAYQQTTKTQNMEGGFIKTAIMMT